MSTATYSPLRYPGGKGKLKKYVEQLIRIKKLNNSTYIEPFCGGAEVGIYLLINKMVKNIIINDYDRSVFALWNSIVNNTDELCKLIEKTSINITEWHKQKKVQQNKSTEDLLTLGFSTLFLNRTNISGIIKAGVIGGLNQNGTYKMDCRFNKKKIIDKIRLIANFKEKIKIYNFDTEYLIDNVIKNLKHKSFIFFDPPYYKKGSSLYTNFYKPDDHLSLANKIKNIKKHSWILTYDNTEEIKKLYKGFKSQIYRLNYSAKNKYKGEEVIIYSRSISNKMPFKDISIYNINKSIDRIK
ncbi:DNA adenine methylase [Clostridium tyrobutyricum]|uniref:DNA adenine methylase n=1 Tax=Clostridium tyrobutyricum TaxID=1519 RepID=UPI001C37EEDD|nr:DNA adenine methylase [Clostridium tyrobutyricum]MBV4429478.1 DNA adenine methylase [Clostridium tyrobutyricum]MBV4444699.1 DNA adenine methylase [Clostridium tyrobutyricum]MBV4447719.1 DNA adenine methylase [Clostridium tyrobutyricum]